MNERLRMVLVLALAVLAALATYQYLARLRETATVVVAVTDIEAGQPIQAHMVASLTVGKHEQQVLAPMAVYDPTLVVGRAPRRMIRKGTILNVDPDDFYVSEDAVKEARGGAVPPAYLISPGLSAVAVPVDADSAVGYTLQKGDLVNVVATWKQGNDVISRTFLVGVEVFETGRLDGGFGGERGALRTVSLLVTPEQAEQVINAKRAGKIDLVLTGRQERP